ILDNLGAIASGNLSAAANLVESVLAKGLPIAISFLASLLGLGGISEKVKEIIGAVRKPITKAVDWVLNTVVRPVARLASKAAKGVKGKMKAGVDWLKKKGKAGADWVKGKFKRDKGKKDEPKKDEPKTGKPLEPVVNVPFAMAGRSHTLTFRPRGGDV